MTAPLTRSDAITALTSWLDAEGVSLDGVAISYRRGMGAGLVATRTLPAGHTACVVPRRLLLTRESGMEDEDLAPLLEELRDDLQDESNGFDESTGFIALQLLAAAAALSRGESTRWAAYVQALPSTVDTPLLWPRARRTTLLAGTSLNADTRELRAASAAELRRMRRTLRRLDGGSPRARPLRVEGGKCARVLGADGRPRGS